MKRDVAATHPRVFDGVWVRAACPFALTFALLTPMAATAQTYTPAPSPYTVQPLTDADLLAEQVRALAVNPLDLNALVRAGELALKLDDTTAAAAFFTRAERIDPRNARVMAGEGSLLVGAERPGEALRRFALAETLGGDVRTFAADRALAYDLIGQPERAQRDYRVALRAGANDETLRRYALSLGISGKRELALAQIDPLLRKSDRGAWRARAFILAMGGDQAGAERIATTMMPTGMGAGLQPFFERLPQLGPADRAFAVHFGEVGATPARLADARLTPQLAALGPDPTAPVAVAAVAARSPVVAEDRKSRRRRDRRRGDDKPVVLAAAPAVTLPTPPVYAGATPTPSVQIASLPQRTIAPARPVAALPTTLPTPTPSVQIASLPARVPVQTPIVTRVIPAASVPAPLVIARPQAPPMVVPTRFEAMPALAPSPSPISAAAADPVVTPPVAAPVPVRSEELILAAIIADIKVPGSELVPAAAEPQVQPLPAAPLKRVVTRAPVETPAPDVVKAVADKKAADKKLSDKKALADKKAAEAKKLADAKAAEEKKKKDPKFLEPSRVWVQVAGGANEGDLPKQWAKLRVKAPVALKGKQGWTTPLRATNRILTGPFKSDDEAQRFVNSAAKEGISGFVFVSDAGQKITRLAIK